MSEPPSLDVRLRDKSLSPDGVTPFLLNKAFITALLLAGTVTGAEEAVLAGIGALGIEEATGETFLLHTVIAAIGDRTPEDIEGASTILPLELQRLLRLPKVPRQCFVLRFLVAWPVELCSRLLHMDASEISRNVSCAAERLARMAEPSIPAA